MAVPGIPLAGVAFVKVDGDQVPLRGNLTIHLTKKKRTGRAGMDGVHGFTEENVVPAIEGDVTTEPGFSIAKALDVVNATIQAECDNGMVYVLRNAWQADVVDLNMVEGSGKFRWEGLDIDEFRGVVA